MTKRVLILGCDETLLTTRKKILQSRGFVAETVLVHANVIDLPATGTPDLVIACSSLSPEARQTSIRRAHESEPKLSCLVVSTDETTVETFAEADGVFSAFDGPEKFVVSVERLIARADGKASPSL